LPGIGETRAKAIIEYREKHGAFNSIEELKNVNGIKDGVYDALKDSICV
ncbi:MAG: helix-hairpin-helix domain-containing protein, partial [Lachnospiraceae bacterium]|nr:helix-hairpin-helix domain-containing protein [Candidatus Merdinaster equi]